MQDMAAMAESGRILLDNLNLEDTPGNREKRMTKRQISANTYAANTPGELYENKFQRMNLLGARKPGVVPNMWSAEEDEMLRAAVEKHGEKNWRVIAQELPNRNHLQCLQRWKKAIRPGLVKGHWSREEDNRLLELINSYKEHGSINNINWASIAQQIDGRNAKQCRERWFLNLDPAINRGPWTPEEDRRLLELAAQCGGRWALIAKNMTGRTENAVKTRYHSLQRQEARGRGWAPDEDQTLLSSTLMFGRDWAKIVKQLPGRSRGQLKKRFNVLTQNKPDHIRKVQEIEEGIENGNIVVPNPPPMPVEPVGANMLKENLIAQKQGQRPSRSSVPSGFNQNASIPDITNWGPSTPPYIPNSQIPSGPGPSNFSTSEQDLLKSWPNISGGNSNGNMQPDLPKKGMYRKYGSSWLPAFFDMDNSPSAPEASTSNNNPASFLARTNSQKLFQDGLVNPSAPFENKSLHRQDQSNMAILDQLLYEGSTENTNGNMNLDTSSNLGDGIEPPKEKGLKQYSSWGSIGGGDFGLFTNNFPDTTTGSFGAPPVMKTGSNKKLPMASNSMNWGSSTQLGTYESDLKGIFNML